MVTRQSGYHNPQFQETCGTTQGGLKYATLLNVVVDSVVRHFLFLMVEDRAFFQDRLGLALGRSLGVFYMNDVILDSQYT